MARRAVVEVRCDRCQRVENQDSEDRSDEFEHELYLVFRGKEVRYTDLCSKCRNSVSNYVDSLTLTDDKEKGSKNSPFLSLKAK